MQEIQNVAIGEILNPSFTVTRQYLEVLTIRRENSVPVIAHISIDATNKEAIVYFPVEGENFFIAVYVDLQEAVTVRWVETEAGSSVYLSIGISNGIDFSLPVEPDRVYKDCKIYGVNIDQPGRLEDKIEKLLNYVYPYKDAICKAGETGVVSINIAYYGYRNQMWGLHLSPTTMMRIAALNAELDLDIYAEGKELY